MKFLHRVASMFRWIVSRRKAEKDLAEELEVFVDMSAEDKVRDGAAPDEARRAIKEYDNEC